MNGRISKEGHLYIQRPRADGNIEVHAHCIAKWLNCTEKCVFFGEPDRVVEDKEKFTLELCNHQTLLFEVLIDERKR